MSDKSTDEVKEEIGYQPIAEFLESTPPNQVIHISDLSEKKRNPYGVYNVIHMPEIQLHCDHEQCLELAGSIRVVLGELSDRLSQALKDEAELTRALSTLMNHKKK